MEKKKKILKIKKKIYIPEKVKIKNFQNKCFLVHIRLQQRSGRKSITIIQGLNIKLDLEKINKNLKREFCCNGCIINDLKLGKIIQLQGDQRENAIKFFLEEKILIRKSIKLHGI
jgi:translation initiation factor 1